MNALAVLFAAAAQVAAPPLSVTEAVNEALTQQPAIVAADANVRVARAREAEARAGRLPRIDFTETVMRSNNPVFVFGSLLEQGEFGQQHFDPAFLNDPEPFTNYRASISARLPLFDRFRTSAAIRQSRNAVDRAGAEVEETRQRVRADVIRRYYGVVLAEEKLRVAGEIVRAAEADAKVTRDRFSQGLVVESEALSVDVHLASLRQRAIAAEGDLAIARAALATVLQRPRTEAIVVDTTLPVSGTEPVALDATIAAALAQRAPVLSATSGIADAEERLRAERGSRLPRVDAFGNYSGSGGTFGDPNPDHAAGVMVTLELFDRGRAPRIAAARAGIDAARAGEALARDAVTMEVVTAWHRLRAARATTAVATEAVAAAEVAARIVRDRYEEGLTTITEHLRAQTALVTARFELLAARYERLVAHAELLRATGDLDDVQPLL